MFKQRWRQSGKIHTIQTAKCELRVISMQMLKLNTIWPSIKTYTEDNNIQVIYAVNWYYSHLVLKKWMRGLRHCGSCKGDNLAEIKEMPSSPVHASYNNITLEDTDSSHQGLIWAARWSMHLSWPEAGWPRTQLLARECHITMPATMFLRGKKKMQKRLADALDFTPMRCCSERNLPVAFFAFSHTAARLSTWNHSLFTSQFQHPCATVSKYKPQAKQNNWIKKILN